MTGRTLPRCDGVRSPFFPLLFNFVLMVMAVWSTALPWRSTIVSAFLHNHNHNHNHNHIIHSVHHTINKVPLRSYRSKIFSSTATNPGSSKEKSNDDGDNNSNSDSNSNNNQKSTTAPSPSPPLSLLSKRLEGLDAPTVWHEFSPLAVRHNSINLGQGFPDWDPPRFLIEELKRSTDPEHPDSDPDSTTANQYARSYAHLPLATALRNDYVNYQWRDSGLPPDVLEGLDPATNVATATGVTNVLYCALQGLIDPGDEVVLLEPFFDIYASQVQLAGGTPVYCPLRSAPSSPSSSSLESESESSASSSTIGASEFFTLDLDELAAALTPRTKVLIINTPHNPTGKMFSRTELEGIADLVANHNKQQQQNRLVVLADEVYQHIVFDPENEPHVSIATVNRGQIWNQTLTLSSAGKTFSCTGWKVGWAIGPEHLVQAVTAVQQWCNFSPVTPTQDAIARALVVARQPYEGYDSYYDWLAADYDQKRRILIDALESAGRRSSSNDGNDDGKTGTVFRAVVPNGGFFVMADTSSIEFPYEEIAATQVTSATPRMRVADPAVAAASTTTSNANANANTYSFRMPRDWALSRWLTTTVGVTAIPPSAFYGPDHLHLASDTLRFAFCKNEATLGEASERLRAYFSGDDETETTTPAAGDDNDGGGGNNENENGASTRTTKGSSPLDSTHSDDSTAAEETPSSTSAEESPAQTDAPLTSAVVRISFDGSKFTGWSAANKGAAGKQQQQPGEVKRRKRGRRRGYVEDFHHGRLPAGFVRSVEGVLKQNFAKLYGDVDPDTRIVVEGCSRTDKGVHATGMIAQVYCLKEGYDRDKIKDSAVVGGGSNDSSSSSSPIAGKRLPHPSSPTDDSSFEPLPMKGNLSRIAFSFNRMRPSDIQITGIAPTPISRNSGLAGSNNENNNNNNNSEIFHASLGSRSKTYEYRLATGFLSDPTQRKSAWHVTRGSRSSPLDLDRITAACELLKGTHDFSAFRGAARGPDEKRKRLREQQEREKQQQQRRRQEQQEQQEQQQVAATDSDSDSGDSSVASNTPGTVCTLYDLRIEEHDPLGIHEDYYFPRADNDNDNRNHYSPMKNYRIVVTGDRFLYKMVRFLVGALVAVGDGTLSLDDLSRALGTGSWERGAGTGAADVDGDGSGKPMVRNQFECAPAHGLTLAHVDYGSDTVLDWQPLRDPAMEQPRKMKQRR